MSCSTIRPGRWAQGDELTWQEQILGFEAIPCVIMQKWLEEAPRADQRSVIRHPFVEKRRITPEPAIGPRKRGLVGLIRPLEQLSLTAAGLCYYSS
jgi:hypothetical protein